MEIFKQIPLYRFLALCNETGLKKEILDCGAGGDTPPLSLFHSYGYSTCGIELSERQIQLANEFADQRGQQLNIRQGDMRKLPYTDEAFSFVYSYNSVFHMRKKDVLIAVGEMKRVLRRGGLLFVNFLNIHDFRVGEGIDLGETQYEQFEDGENVIHSYYEYFEADPLFSDMECLYKEYRVLERDFEGNRIRQGFVDYILRKS